LEIVFCFLVFAYAMDYGPLNIKDELKFNPKTTPMRKKLQIVFSCALFLLLFAVSAMAQAPNSFNYQAVVRNASGEVIAGTEVSLRLSIIKGGAFGTSVFVETHKPTTNSFGLVSFAIGSGTAVVGNISSVDWSADVYFLKVELDATGGSTYTELGVSQILSVPYSIHAKESQILKGSITESQVSDLKNYLTTETDPVFNTSPAQGITGTNITNWNTAFGWGNHSGLYRPVSWVPSWADVTEKPTTFTPSAHTHGSMTNTGSIGSTAGRIVTTGASGALQATAGTTAGQMLYWNGTAWVNVPPGNTGNVLTLINGVPTWGGPGIGMGTNDVYNPITGRIWSDRNLGATQVATSSTDANSYGHLYQWGRGTDGHQVRTSSTTTNLSSSDSPGHGNFILTTSSPYDWRNPQNTNLWQGVSGVNNPCPAGYRLPTEAEWNAERLSWSYSNAAGAFASPLKLPVAGYRLSSSGSLFYVGSDGFYWSSTVSSTNSRYLLFYSGDALMSSNGRANGSSVRCIKE
jgi:uncharacterized protein (TIGR02145 family)